MPRPQKLTGEKKQDLTAAICTGAAPKDLATRYGVSVQYVYKLKNEIESVPKKYEDEGELLNIHKGYCVACQGAFVRWQGEETKTLCSTECFEEYRQRDYPPKDPVLYPGKSSPHGSLEFRDMILAKNSMFFFECGYVSETGVDWLTW